MIKNYGKMKQSGKKENRKEKTTLEELKNFIREIQKEQSVEEKTTTAFKPERLKSMRNYPAKGSFYRLGN